MSDPRLLDALCGRDAASERAVSLRTRRAVYHALAERRSGRMEGRRNLLLALLLTGLVTFALAPALWAWTTCSAGKTFWTCPGCWRRSA